MLVLVLRVMPCARQPQRALSVHCGMCSGTLPAPLLAHNPLPVRAIPFLTSLFPPSLPNSSVAGNYLNLDANKCVPCTGYTPSSTTIIVVVMVVIIGVAAALCSSKKRRAITELGRSVSDLGRSGSQLNLTQKVQNSRSMRRLEWLRTRMGPKLKILITFSQLGT